MSSPRPPSEKRGGLAAPAVPGRPPLKLERADDPGVSAAAQKIPRGELEDVAEVLRPAILRLSRRLYREAQKIGASALDVQLLSVIKARPGIGVNELAAKERMSAPTMSAHVKRLERAGWVLREAEPESGDRRRAPLRLSPDGASALEAIRRSRTDFLLDRLAGLDPEEFFLLRAAVPALQKLQELEP